MSRHARFETTGATAAKAAPAGAPLPPARRSWPIVALLTLMIGAQVSLAAYSLFVLSSVRAFVAGESLYSKGQKDAQIYLLAYTKTHVEADYQRLLHALAVPIGDRRAREALQQPEPDLEAARQGFVEGGNHPDDVPGLIHTFRWYGRTPLMSRAIALWTEGDGVIEQMRELAEHTRRRVLAGVNDAGVMRQIQAEARVLNDRLTLLEREFSDQLGQASRLTARLLLALNGLLALLLAGLGIAFVRRTARRQALTEADLRREQMLMQRLVASVTDGVITYTDELRILVFNPAAEKLFLTPARRALGTSAAALFVEQIPDPKLTSEQPESNLAELTGARADGSTFRLEASFARMLTDDDGALNTVVLRDITAREAARAERLAREALEATSQAKTLFLSRMSHELRTPLNAVLGFAQLLRVDASCPPSTQQLERVRHIEKAGSHLLALVNDVLDLSRIEAGEMAISTQPVEVSAAVEEAATLVSPLVTQTGIELIVAPKPAPPARSPPSPSGLPATRPAAAPGAVWVNADPLRLRQVLVNLLSNAVKYNRPAGRVSVSWSLSGGQCVIAIADTGQGIATEKMSRLFEPFDRLGAEASNIEGTGIGLVLSRRLAEMMGGRLGIESTIGQGTVATVVLGVVAPATASSEPHLPAQPAAADQRRLEVLYAEDNEVNAEIVRQLVALRPAVSLRIAENGHTALRMALARPPDLMLVDMNLGDMTGLELARELRSHDTTRGIELVALSADALPEQIDTAMRSGFSAYLTKPVDFDALLALLDGRRPPS